MTIRKLVEIFSKERQDDVIGEEEVREYVNALETKICTEVFLTHEDPPPGVYAFMGMRPPTPGRDARWNTGDPLELGNPPEPYPLPQPGPMDWPPPLPPHPPGYSDEWTVDDYKNTELLVPPPFDDVYRAYIQWRADLAQNDTHDFGNSKKIYWMAYQDFARFWHRTHMPVNSPVYRGYKE